MDLYRVFGWLIPGLCMAGSVALAIRQNSALHEAQLDLDASLVDVQAAKIQKLAVDSHGGERRYAAAASSDLEQTLFLSDLRTRVATHGAVITSWTTRTAAYGNVGNASVAKAQDPQETELLKGIVRVSSTLTLAGSYSAIRRFLGDLSASDRLFTLSHVSWTRSKEGTTLIVTVSRYVAPVGSDAGRSARRASATRSGPQPKGFANTTMKFGPAPGLPLRASVFTIKEECNS